MRDLARFTGGHFIWIEGFSRNELLSSLKKKYLNLKIINLNVDTVDL